MDRAIADGTGGPRQAGEMDLQPHVANAHGHDRHAAHRRRRPCGAVRRRPVPPHPAPRAPAARAGCRAGAHRDAIAKFLYARLFDWIVLKINRSLSRKASGGAFVGLLDIYGFEIFKLNRYDSRTMLCPSVRSPRARSAQSINPSCPGCAHAALSSFASTTPTKSCSKSL